MLGEPSFYSLLVLNVDGQVRGLPSLLLPLSLILTY